tara:strand:+ start:925 stop:1797 length:873 start_codon:yes stop_codon:yes gene_type:complete
MTDWLQEHHLLGDSIRTGLLIITLLLTRWIILRRIRASMIYSTELRRRWAAQLRLVVFLLMLLGIAVIWGTELRTFALSVVAIAAAIVIATKELIMCVSGSILRASGKSFQIGDRVEINSIRGDVVDQTLLTTTIIEVGPGTNIHQRTGRTIVFPNSILLTSPVINETFLDDYVLHAFTVPLSQIDRWEDCERAIINASKEECSPFLAAAQQHIEQRVRKEGLEPMSVAPRVTLKLDDPDTISMLVRIPVPARRKGRVEQDILRKYLKWREPVRAELIRIEQKLASEFVK